MKSLLYIGIGGGLGSILRYIVQVFIGRHVPLIFPLGTFVVNCSGCFLIGIFYSLATKYTTITPEWRLFLITGICGGFTTFSTFAFENMSLLRSGDFLYFSIYIVASVALGIAGVFAGVVIMKLL